MITVLIAGGPNSVEVPCRIFPDMATGRKRCEEIFGVPGRESSDAVIWGFKEIDLDTTSESNTAVSEKLFTSHYYGCGGPGPFTLKEVPFDEAFVGFDLD